MKTNKEVFQDLGQTFADIQNDRVSPKELKKKLIETIKAQIALNMELKTFSKCVTLANKRGDVLVEIKQGDITLHGLPLALKEFYFKDGQEPSERFTIEGLEYLVIFRHEDFEI
ncbi:MAG: hypothetical protein ACYCZO_10115 [Daejeonella sp.]